MGWFIVYLLAVGINAYILLSEDVRINNPNSGRKFMKGEKYDLVCCLSVSPGSEYHLFIVC